jgi:hypothetical protein
MYIKLLLGNFLPIQDPRKRGGVDHTNEFYDARREDIFGIQNTYKIQKRSFHNIGPL